MGWPLVYYQHNIIKGRQLALPVLGAAPLRMLETVLPEREAIGQVAQVQAPDVEHVLERGRVRRVCAHARAEGVRRQPLQARVVGHRLRQPRLFRQQVPRQRPSARPCQRIAIAHHRRPARCTASMCCNAAPATQHAICISWWC